MAEQNANPEPWEWWMGDGCTGAVDWLPFIGDMTDCCSQHDKRYHYGGSRVEKAAADREFKQCLANNPECRFCLWFARNIVAPIRYAVVNRLADDAWNWDGPGMPEERSS